MKKNVASSYFEWALKGNRMNNYSDSHTAHPGYCQFESVSVCFCTLSSACSRLWYSPRGHAPTGRVSSYLRPVCIKNCKTTWREGRDVAMGHSFKVREGERSKFLLLKDTSVVQKPLIQIQFPTSLKKDRAVYKVCLE